MTARAWSSVGCSRWRGRSGRATVGNTFALSGGWSSPCRLVQVENRERLGQAIAGAVVVSVIGLITHHVLLTAVVVLAVFVLLLGHAGTRLERELHGDPGIGLLPGPPAELIRPRAEKRYLKTAEFTVTVETVRPDPPQDGLPAGRAPGMTLRRARDVSHLAAPMS